MSSFITPSRIIIPMIDIPGGSIRNRTMNSIYQLLILSRWEIKRLFSSMSRDILPLSIILFICLIGTSNYISHTGLHLQDNLYTIGFSSADYTEPVISDNRFIPYDISGTLAALSPASAGLDIGVQDGVVIRAPGEKAKAAQKAVEQDYQRYVNSVYRQQTDIFAAYPLWINTQYITSQINFLSIQSGSQYRPFEASDEPPVPEGVAPYIEPPNSNVGRNAQLLKMKLDREARGDNRYNRYSDLLGSGSDETSNLKIPSSLSPPLPFDTIILIFVFIFPLYFTSQFFMMSIMNERTLRQGEALIAAPVRSSILIIGKMLPYAGGMLLLIIGISLFIGAGLMAIPPLIPVILFFLAFALLIGMVSRSYKELSFISIFFSTIATSYLFFPSIFANVHIISLLSPITLVVREIEGMGYTGMEYLYATSLFYLISLVIFFFCIYNFKEEQLFAEKTLIEKCIDLLSSVISLKYWYLSLIGIAIITIPFVFMTQMLLLVLLFNLPMPFSIIILIILAALTEEVVKAAGLVSFLSREKRFFQWRYILAASCLIAFGFLAGEKLLLFITISQVSESVFGAVMFLSLGMLWIPFLLHATGVLCTGIVIKVGGMRALPVGILLATIVHSAYNLYLLKGWL